MWLANRIFLVLLVSELCFRKATWDYDEMLFGMGLFIIFVS